MLNGRKLLRRYFILRNNCECSFHFSNVSNGSVLKSNIDVNSKEYQVNLFKHLLFNILLF